MGDRSLVLMTAVKPTKRNYVENKITVSITLAELNASQMSI